MVAGGLDQRPNEEELREEETGRPSAVSWKKMRQGASRDTQKMEPWVVSMVVTVTLGF